MADGADPPPHPRIAFDAGLRRSVAGRLGRFERRAEAVDDLHHAAVACVIAPGTEPPARRGEACFLLTRRASTLAHHSGQWALPGGRLDAGESPVQAALRELHEEVGVALAASDVLGLLDDYRTRSGFCITPVVVWCESLATLAANPAEVDVIHQVPLADAASADAARPYRLETSEQPLFAIHLRSLATRVHAPTAAVIHQLCEVCVHGRDTRVGHYDQPRFAWR